MSFSITTAPPERLRNPSGIAPETAIASLFRHRNSTVSSSMLLISAGGIVEDFVGGRRKPVWGKRYSYVEVDRDYLNNIVESLKVGGADFITLLNFLDTSRTIMSTDNYPYAVVVAVRPVFVTDSDARFFVTVGGNGVFYSRDGWFVRGSSGESRLGDLAVGSWYVVFVHVFFDTDTSEYKMDVFLMDNGFSVIGSATGVVVDRYDFSMFLFDFDDVTLDIIGSVGIDWVIGLGRIYATFPL